MMWFGKSFINFCKSFINLVKIVSTRTCSSPRVRMKARHAQVASFQICFLTVTFNIYKTFSK